MAHLKNTKGDWILKDCTIINPNHDSKKGDIYEIAQCYTGFNVDNTIAQCKANAELFLDAGKTANECDLLPSELLKQRDELLHSLTRALNDFKNSTWTEETYKLIEGTIEKITKK